MSAEHMPGSDSAIPAREESAVEACHDQILLESPIEMLVQRSRAPNALRSLGCKTVRDVLRVDLLGPARGIGPKTRSEVVRALQNSGFRYAGTDEPSDSDIRRLDHSLKRMNDRINAALAAVAREIAIIQKRLRRQNEAGHGRRNRARIAEDHGA
jgi:hypothetical protein